MELNYTIYRYDADRNAVIMTDMDGRELVIECDKAEANVIYEEPLDAAYLSRLAREEPAKQKDIDDGNQHKRNSKNMIFTVFITVALEILLMYILGITYENDRSSYKIVLVEQEADEDSKYIFHYQSRQMNYTICPIVFENSDYYILTRLYKRDGKIEMDYEYQKIIEKTDTETFNCENIYGINIGE